MEPYETGYETENGWAENPRGYEKVIPVNIIPIELPKRREITDKIEEK